MRVLLSTYGSRGDVEPLVGLAVQLRTFPSEVTDNRMLWDLDAQSNNALFCEALNTNRASIGLPPVDDVRGSAVARTIRTDGVMAAAKLLLDWSC